MSSRRVLAVAAVLLGVLAGCSNTQAPPAKGPHDGTATASPSGGVQVITLQAGNDYRFHPSTFVVRPGKVKVVLENTSRSGAPHNWSLSGFPGDFVPLAGAGQTTSDTFTAPAPGRYRFVCTIHVQQGQVGTMVVRG